MATRCRIRTEISFMKWMMNKRKMKYFILFLLLSATLAVAGFQIYSELSSRQKEKRTFDSLVEMVTLPDNHFTDTDSISEDSTEQTESDRDLTELFRQNDECVGWICIPDTTVNYPVMYTPDESQKYLRRNFYGEYSVCGVPFLDGRCALESPKLIIYGHNMNNGTMFADLTKYINDDFKQSHSAIEFETANVQKKYIVSEVKITDISDKWYSNVDAETDGQVLILSTCYGWNENGRLLIIAKEEK